MSLAQSTANFGPETIIDLLENQGTNIGGYGFDYGDNYGEGESSTWQNTTPEVYHWDEVTQQSKENNNDPSLYVWSPVDMTMDDFSADGNLRQDIETVEVQCWTLDRTTSRQYAEDVRDIIEEYMRDNYLNTNWNWIKPQSMNDARAEKTARRTDHYIVTVQIELERLRDTGK